MAQLVVNIVGAKDLPIAKGDYYCLVTPNEKEIKPLSTQVLNIKDGNNPQWNEELVFPVNDNLKEIKVQVFDKYVLWRDTPLGTATLQLDEMTLGKERVQDIALDDPKNGTLQLSVAFRDTPASEPRSPRKEKEDKESKAIEKLRKKELARISNGYKPDSVNSTEQSVNNLKAKEKRTERKTVESAQEISNSQRKLNEARIQWDKDVSLSRTDSWSDSELEMERERREIEELEREVREREKKLQMNKDRLERQRRERQEREMKLEDLRREEREEKAKAKEEKRKSREEKKKKEKKKEETESAEGQESVPPETPESQVESKEETQPKKSPFLFEVNIPTIGFVAKLF